MFKLYTIHHTLHMASKMHVSYCSDILSRRSKRFMEMWFLTNAILNIAFQAAEDVFHIVAFYVSYGLAFLQLLLSLFSDVAARPEFRRPDRKKEPLLLPLRDQHEFFDSSEIEVGENLRCPTFCLPHRCHPEGRTTPFCSAYRASFCR